MRRFVIVALMFALILPAIPHAALAQADHTYRNDELGLVFQYPTDWVVRDQPQTQSIIAASKADLEAVAAGKAPQGLLFSISISSFRIIGAARAEDFPNVLAKITKTDATPTPVTINGAEGLLLDTVDTAQDVATRTVILSIGGRRVAVVRGLSTIAVWTTGGGEGRFNELKDSLNFFPPQGRAKADTFGRVMWQIPADNLTDFSDLSVSGDGATLYVTERTQGIWQVSANGIARDVIKPDGIGAFGAIGVLRTGALYIADPVTHEVWVVDTTTNKITRLLGGRLGTGKAEFGANSPRYFAFGVQGQLYVLDENDKGLRIQIFNRGGDWLGVWDLKDVLPTPIDTPVISTDNDGNVYVIGRNTPGIIKINGTGKIVSKDLGKDYLANAGARSLLVDRVGNFYVATADQGILNLSANGQLLGIIGDAYDESAPPKPGQIGKPSALALAEGGKLLYVADSGKYPQVVAFALTANGTINVASGTRDAGPIIYGQTVNGEINVKTFIDAYTFDGKAGDVITITMTPGDGSPIDPYIDLLGAKGLRLAANDDAKAKDLPPKSAQIKSYRLPIATTYTIRATRYGRETTTTTGTYTLTLTLERVGKK